MKYSWRLILVQIHRRVVTQAVVLAGTNDVMMELAAQAGNKGTEEPRASNSKMSH